MKIKIIDAKRTPIGKFLGSFYEADCSNVCVQTINNLNSLYKKSEIVIFGNAISSGLGQGIARKIAINAGIDVKTPAYLTSMVCGSGMQAVINGCNEIKLGKQLVLVGGFEFMSNIPFATNSYLRLGKKFGDFSMIDLMTHDGLIDSFSGVHMGITAENIAKKYNISREEQDNFAFRTQQRAIAAVDSDVFKDEIVPIKLFDHKGNEYIFDKDEFPNRSSSLEKLATLKPTFLKDGTGTVTAGNSSGINDGAAFLLLSSEKFCKKNNIDSNIEIIDYCTIGCDPQLMGLGPYHAIKKLLSRNKIDLSEIGVFEINEAFSAQALGCIKLLCKDFHCNEEEMTKKTNINGSGLGLGHPLGCTGSRILVTLFHYMKKHNCKYGVASLCIGGGMGAAVLLKKE